MSKPILTEPGVKYFLSKTLFECKKFKDNNINLLYNSGAAILIIIIVGGFLYFNYNKNNKNKQKEKELLKKKYILEKVDMLTKYNNEKMRHKNNIINDLPILHNYI